MHMQVLVPTDSLIGEWVQQALVHTRGFHVLVQRPNGTLVSRGESQADQNPGVARQEHCNNLIHGHMYRCICVQMHIYMYIYMSPGASAPPPSALPPSW